MPRKYRTFFEGAIHHVFFRGNRKQLIFRCESDYDEYIGRLEDITKQEDVDMHAYSIMPNHGHLILQQMTENPLSNLMQRLQGGFTQYLNKKYEQVGHVFQGRYKAILCTDEQYLLELVRYIHLNAPRAGLVEAPEEYPWCSHRAYLFPEKDGFVETALIKSYFNNIRSFDQFIKSGLKNDEKIKELNLAIETAIQKGISHPLPTLNELFCGVVNECGFNIKELKGKRYPGGLISLFVSRAKEYNFSVGDIANFLNIHRTTVGRLAKMHHSGSDPE